MDNSIIDIIADNIGSLIGQLNIGLAIAEQEEKDLVHLPVEDVKEAALYLRSYKHFLEEGSAQKG